MSGKMLERGSRDRSQSPIRYEYTSLNPRDRSLDREKGISLPKSIVKNVSNLKVDQHKTKQRQKQIDFGKNTVGYEIYSRKIPKNERILARKFEDMPVTPDINLECSKRAWDGIIKKWRRILHTYDPTEENPFPKGEFEINAEFEHSNENISIDFKKDAENVLNELIDWEE